MEGRILIVEDEPDVRKGLRTVLEAEGFRVLEAADGSAGLAKALEEKPDLVVLDLMVPGLDGFEVARGIRGRGLTSPILILTARAGEVDKVLGFELGADDYVTKPFGVRELIARVRALLRRAAPRPGSPEKEKVGDAAVDWKRLTLERGGRTFELYHYEAEILKLLLGHEGEVVSRNRILEEVWGRDAFPTTRTVDYHVCNLRKKLERDPSRPEHIQTVHGIGYRLVR